MVIVKLFVQAVDEEDHRLLHLLGQAEVVLCGYLYTTGSIDKEDGGVGDAHCGEGRSGEVVRTRAVDNVEFLVVPLNMERRGEDAVSVLLLYGEVVGNGVLLCDASSTRDDAALVEQRFGEGGLSCTVTAQEGNVLDFFRLIGLH